MEETFGERLGKALRARKKIGRAVATHLGLDREETITDWKANRGMPGTANLIELIRHLDVSADWLIFGYGQMERAAPGEEAAQLLQEVQRLAREIERLTAGSNGAKGDTSTGAANRVRKQIEDGAGDQSDQDHKSPEEGHG